MLAACAALLLHAAPASIDELIARIPSVATTNGGVSADGQALSKLLQREPEETIPKLLLLLQDTDPAVRDFAGFVLSGIDGLEPKHVDALIAALKSGNGWIAPAIAHAKSPRGIRFLADELVARPRTGDQLVGALSMTGDDGATALANELRSAKALGPVFRRALCECFESFSNATPAAADAFLSVAKTLSLDIENRATAVHAIGCPGGRSAAVVPDLEEMRRREPALAADVNDAIVRTRTKAAVPILVRALWGNPNPLSLERIAELREEGRSAGPEVARLLESSDWDLRDAAARVLGLIGYGDAADALIGALSNEDDWELVEAAAESLGRTHALPALAALDRIARSHWDKGTRETAKKAGDVIRGKSQYVTLDPDQIRQLRFFDRSRRQTGPLPKLNMGVGELSPAQLVAYAYRSDLHYSYPSGVASPATSGLMTDDGVLLGRDYGEFGGELVRFKPDGSVIKLLNQDTHGIHHLGSNTLALVGLAHMSFNSGMIYRVTGGHAERWKRLPGAPQASGFLEDGRLFIQCASGNVVVTADGRLEEK
jgi:HEAT repeat protein